MNANNQDCGCVPKRRPGIRGSQYRSKRKSHAGHMAATCRVYRAASQRRCWPATVHGIDSPGRRSRLVHSCRVRGESLESARNTRACCGQTSHSRHISHCPGELVPLIGRHIKEIGPKRKETRTTTTLQDHRGIEQVNNVDVDVDADADAELALCSLSLGFGELLADDQK